MEISFQTSRKKFNKRIIKVFYKSVSQNKAQLIPSKYFQNFIK